MTPELQRVLWACYQCWVTSPNPPATREIWYGWILGGYRERFSASFHQSALQQLAGLGFLQAGGNARGGRRRYYTLPNPERVRQALDQWGLLTPSVSPP